MNDPYKILGVSPAASDEEIKSAYRELARKYHPDNYGNNPLSDLAEEKMKEINTAYDQIMQNRSGGGQNTSVNEKFAQIRASISADRIDEADAALDYMPQQDRQAEWHFLKGSILYKRGWFSEAYRYYQQAYNMDPHNAEYRAAFQNMRGQQVNRGGYNPYGGGNNSGNRNYGGGCNGCDFCSSLICADCCCECFGGDLISCC